MESGDTKDYSSIEESVNFLAQKFSLLLATSSLPEERQQEILAKLPELNLEQLIDLVEALEADYTNSQTTELDTDLENTLSRVVDNFSATEKALDDDLIKKLSTLEKELD